MVDRATDANLPELRKRQGSGKGTDQGTMNTSARSSSVLDHVPLRQDPLANAQGRRTAVIAFVKWSITLELFEPCSS
uniref:Uncharacterized protein n=1 Tax=Physcomitrium patens TaxID=3218 RepID=A0A2K1JQ67_PHYPA|nr:hypothetical protein PHYPA_016061 [Physcomitrium patens]